MVQPGSLSEGAAERSEAEGVSSDGCSGPTIYPPAIINSEIFERIRASCYTPSASLGMDVPFNVPPGNWKVAGDFHRPYGTQRWVHFTIHRGTLPQSRIRSTAPSGREPGMAGTIQRTAQEPEGCGRFSSPLRKRRGGYISPFIGGHSLSLSLARQLPQRGSREWLVPFNVPPGNRKVAGDFHRPYENSGDFYILPSRENFFKRGDRRKNTLQSK